MDEKILAFGGDASTYRTLAEKSINNGDYEKAFCFLFSALDKVKNPYEIYGDLADAYYICSDTEDFYENEVVGYDINGNQVYYWCEGVC
jgi:hypothetical protein